MGIDYALFLLSRHRDQLGEGLDVEESIARATATAGSAVIFAGLTVVIALLGLAVAGIAFLTTMGLAAAAAVAIAVAIGVTLVPALMAFAGERLRPKTVRSPSKKGAHRARFSRVWVRLVTRVPLLTVVVVVGGLAVCALPAADLRLALPDNGTEEEGTPARDTYEVVSEHFGPGYNGPLIVTADIITSTDPVGVVYEIADEISRLPGVASVPLATPNPKADTGVIQVVPAAAPDSAQTGALVTAIRGQREHFQNTYGVDTAVTGITAVGIDVSTQLGAALLPFAILVIGFPSSCWRWCSAPFGFRQGHRRISALGRRCVRCNLVRLPARPFRRPAACHHPADRPKRPTRVPSWSRLELLVLDLLSRTTGAGESTPGRVLKLDIWMRRIAVDIA